MKQETKVLSIIGAVTLIVLAGGIFFLSKSSPNTASPANTQPVNPQLLIKPDSNQTASQSAKVNLVEFGDYECPSCFQAYPIIKQILGNYDGKINFVFRNFPLPQHKNAQIAAEAAEAAGAQGKYWPMHDALYDHQNDWAEVSNPLNIFKTYAQSMGLNMSQFQSDVQSNKFSNKINEDINDGYALGVNATPTFYLNNKLYSVGVPSYDGLKSKIDSALSQ